MFICIFFNYIKFKTMNNNIHQKSAIFIFQIKPNMRSDK